MAMFETLARVMTSPHATLKVECGACGHRTVWSRADAYRRLGPDCTPYDVARKLFCGECKNGDRVNVWI